MARLLEIIIGTVLFVVMLSPLVALVAGLTALVAGMAFIPVFAPLTTMLAIGLFIYMSIREGRRRKRHRRTNDQRP